MDLVLNYSARRQYSKRMNQLRCDLMEILPDEPDSLEVRMNWNFHC